jgi:hypothetical protein
MNRTLAALIAGLVAISALSQVEASENDVSTQARRASVQVSLMGVVPGTQSGNGDWCVGTGEVVLTAVVVDPATQSEVNAGTLVWQVCNAPATGFPKEDCAAPGPARWRGAVLSDLAFDSTPSLGVEPIPPVLGFRLQFRPVQGSGLARSTSAPFNLDTTCSP